MILLLVQKTSPTVFTIDTSKGEPSATPTYALKHIMSANDAVSDVAQESIAARGNTFYGGGVYRTAAKSHNIHE